ncbi:hypothetical protein HS088_TW21G01156 [Tripterygium wilfordii]|uniref:Sulfite exporter TauE/SafE family protein n=1 Tax=Tripterygium wilfordii TaxID=458696 RepID=A0A7J7C4B0_TRIWF|nr:sulfite exporter TauE/SafE family protein 2-like [Tripterygium wilfordii]KAF5728999.1 hypothetical protein HS088_TW21G01156 [Tripterygium wilfordii]
MEDFSSNFFKWVVHYETQTQKMTLKMGAPMVMAGILCFIAASISSAGGIGGGGLFIPILMILAGLDLKTASSFSAFMVTGGSTANFICNLFIRSAKFGGKGLIDYDIALLSEPCMLLGVSAGVICNRVFPEWLITILFVVFLAWSTFKTCRNGILLWKFESEQVIRNGIEEVENYVVRDGDRSEVEVPLLGMKRSNTLGFPWMKVCILVMVWLAFFALYLLRGSRNGQACGGEYWILSSLQIPLAIVFTAWILWIMRRKESNQHQTPKQQDTEDLTSCEPPSRLIFPIMALMAGLLGGVFGIGGGMLISPFLLQVGIPPEVTAATCSFMVFFSSTMSAFQYLFLGMEHTDTALIFSVICFVASLIGLMVVQGAIQTYGRASLIVFSVGLVMALSTILISSFGALDVWHDYESGNYMGFKSAC